MSLLPHNHHGGLFVAAPLDAVANCLVRWGNEDKVGRFTTAQRQRLPLEQAWTLLAERRWDPDRAVLLPVGAAWTGFFDNHSHEFAPAAEMHILSERLNVGACWFFYDDHEGEHRGSAQFIADRVGGAGQHRYVSVTNEGGWNFDEKGLRMPFERTDLYALRRKRDRLNGDVLRGYADALGIPFSDPAAYGQDVVFLRWGEKPSADTASALRKLMRIFGRPAVVAGALRPPDVHRPPR
jgi:hypothetical protein